MSRPAYNHVLETRAFRFPTDLRLTCGPSIIPLRIFQPLLMTLAGHIGGNDYPYFPSVSATSQLLCLQHCVGPDSQRQRNERHIVGPRQINIRKDEIRNSLRCAP